MSGTTGILGLPYPEDTDPVANYPTTGQALANAVEAAILAGGGGSSEGSHVGTIVAWAGSTPPQGWQVCDGSPALSPSLVALVGANVPDLRDRFVVGVSGTKAKGATGGAATVTLSEAQMPGHTHADNGLPVINSFIRYVGVAGTQAGEHNHSVGRGTGSYADAGDGAPFPQHRHSLGAAGGGQAHQNMPPYYALAWIIKHTGAAANGITREEADLLYEPLASASVWQALPVVSGITPLGAPWPAPRFRLHRGMVEIDLMANTGAALGAGAVIATLPVGFRPVYSQRFPGVGRVWPGANGATFHDVRPTGEITVSSAVGTAGIEAGGSIRLAGIVPLD